MIEEENSHLDVFFKNKLNNYSPLPDKAIWEEIKHELSFESRYHIIDDTFHDSLSDYSEKTPKMSWDKIKKNLEEQNSFDGLESLSRFSATPPDWVWSSIKYYTSSEAKANRKKKAFAYLFLFLLAASTVTYFNYYIENPNSTISQYNKQLFTHKKEISNVHIYPQKKISTQLPSKTQKNVLEVKENLFKSYIEDYKENMEGAAFSLEKSSVNLKNIAILPLFKNNKNIELSVPINRPKNKKTSPFSLRISASKNMSYRTLKGDENDTYINIRKNSESVLTTFSAFALINYTIKKLKLSSGIMYTQRGEKAKYDFKTTSETQTSVFFYDQNTSSLFSVPYKYKLTYDHQKNTENIYEYIEIPIKASYILNKNKVTISPAISFNTGLLIKATGTTITASNSLGKLELNSLNYANINRYNFSIGGSVDIAYKVSPKTSVFIEPYINNSINNSLKEVNNIKQKFNNKGVGFGIEISL